MTGNPVFSLPNKTLTRTVTDVWPLRVSAVCAALLLFWNLSYAPLWNPDEGRYASAALEMSGQLPGGAGDWVIPHLNTVPRLNKPPLNLWLGAALLRLFGPSEIAVRLVSALAALGVMVCLWIMGRRHLDESKGLLGALVWATAIFPFVMGRVFNTDMTLTFSLTLALLGLYPLCGKEEAKVRDLLTAGAGLGLAALAKGPVGLILPLFISFAFVALTRGWKRVAWLKGIGAVLLGFAIATPWFWLAEARHPGFLRNFFFSENLARFSGSHAFHKAQPLYFFVPVLIVGLLPWTAFLPLLREKVDRPRLFLWLWAGIIIVGFSLSKVKLISYVLPAFPALALLLGAALAGWSTRSFRVRRTCTLLLLVFFGVALSGAAFFLLNDKIVPGSEGGPWVILLALFLMAGMGAVWHGISRRDLPLRVAGLAGILNITLLALAGHIALYEDASPPLRAVRSYLMPEDRLVLWRTFQPTATFYSRRPAEIFDAVDNSGLDEEAMKRSPYFQAPTAKTLAQILSVPQRVLIMARRRDLKTPPRGAFMWAINNDYLFFSNRPRPTDFVFNFVAPRKR